VLGSSFHPGVNAAIPFIRIASQKLGKPKLSKYRFEVPFGTFSGDKTKKESLETLQLAIESLNLIARPTTIDAAFALMNRAVEASKQIDQLGHMDAMHNTALKVARQKLVTACKQDIRVDLGPSPIDERHLLGASWLYRHSPHWLQRRIYRIMLWLHKPPDFTSSVPAVIHNGSSHDGSALHIR
jgi:hypothetical protein